MGFNLVFKALRYVKKIQIQLKLAQSIVLMATHLIFVELQDATEEFRTV